MARWAVKHSIDNSGNEQCLILDVNDNIVNFERNLAFSEFDLLWD